MDNHSIDNTYPDDYSDKPAPECITPDIGLKPRNKKKILLFTIIPSAIFIVLFTLFLCLPLFLSENTIAANVWIGNVNVGNMTRDEAISALKSQYKQQNITFSATYKHNGHTKKTSFSSEDIELCADPTVSADAAYKIGRSENRLKNSWNLLTSYLSKKDVTPVYQFNSAKAEKIFRDFGQSIYGAHRDEVFTTENNTLSVTPENPGAKEDVSKAVSEFSESIKNGRYSEIPVTLESNAPTPLTFDEVYSKIYIPPTNSSYQVINNQVVITDSLPGQDADHAQINALIEQVNSGSPAAIPLIPVPVQYTKEMLLQSLFNSTLSSYSSKYKTSSENRAYNVELAASKINGLIIADGEEFSYNKVIGNAGLENGYKTSTVYSEGKVIEGVGGGVCQVSSTLYCAVLRTGLDVTKRYNHSLPVSYVPGGQDATVAYDYLDFRFKNNTGAPVKIIATCSDRTVTVTLLGSDFAYKNVEVTSEKIETIQPGTIKTEDPTLPAGQTRVITQGTPGGVYLTHRKIYNPDGTLLVEKQTKSTYKAIATEIAVGTKTVEATTVVPTEKPVEIPTELPAETPAEIPTELPAETPAEIPAEPSVETPPVELPQTEPTVEIIVEGE